MSKPMHRCRVCTHSDWGCRSCNAEWQDPPARPEGEPRAYVATDPKTGRSEIVYLTTEELARILGAHRRATVDAEPEPPPFDLPRDRFLEEGDICARPWRQR